uniref:Uncharacterized protein n=1 Tax=Panagrolaimus davidi TaxID=227884 RepID=A0A914PVB9_9BILA
MFYDDKLDDVNKKGISRSDEQIDSSYLLAGDEAFVLFKSMYLLHSNYAYYRRLLKSNNFCFASIADVKDHPTFQSGNAMNLALRSLLPGFIHKKIKRIIVGTCEDKNIEKILECYMLEINEEVALYSPTNYVQKCHFMKKVLNDLRMACYVLPSLPRAHTPFLIFQTNERTMMSICYKSDNTIQDTVLNDEVHENVKLVVKVADEDIYELLFVNGESEQIFPHFIHSGTTHAIDGKKISFVASDLSDIFCPSIF